MKVGIALSLARKPLSTAPLKTQKLLCGLRQNSCRHHVMNFRSWNTRRQTFSIFLSLSGSLWCFHCKEEKFSSVSHDSISYLESRERLRVKNCKVTVNLLTHKKQTKLKSFSRKKTNQTKNKSYRTREIIYHRFPLLEAVSNHGTFSNSGLRPVASKNARLSCATYPNLGCSSFAFTSLSAGNV